MPTFPAKACDRSTLFRVLLVAALLTISFLALTRLTIPVATCMNDKVNHVTAFFVLALLVDHAFPAWAFRTTVLALFAYGLSLEIAQAISPIAVVRSLTSEPMQAAWPSTASFSRRSPASRSPGRD